MFITRAINDPAAAIHQMFRAIVSLGAPKFLLMHQKYAPPTHTYTQWLQINWVWTFIFKINNIKLVKIPAQMENGFVTPHPQLRNLAVKGC